MSEKSQSNENLQDSSNQIHENSEDDKEYFKVSKNISNYGVI